jgi:hypothetical protein
MDVLIDLLPSVNRVQLENAKKDKRQRNKYSRQMSSQSSRNSAKSDTETPVSRELKQVLWVGVERRSIQDRRQVSNKRGRWLESRGRNDRRAIAEKISVKI